MEKIEFELIENNVTTKYNYFGKLNWNDDGIGLNFIYPEENSKSKWFEVLSSVSECMAAAVLGVLFNDFKNGRETFETNYQDIFDIVCTKQFENYINKWYDADGALFQEGPFFDGIFGRFSAYGDLGHPDNHEEDICEVYHWKDNTIKIIFSEKRSIDELYGKLFIDTNVESLFKNELQTIIELFNSNDNKYLN
jgi:hypothetical protein